MLSKSYYRLFFSCVVAVENDRYGHQYGQMLADKWGETDGEDHYGASSGSTIPQTQKLIPIHWHML